MGSTADTACGRAPIGRRAFATVGRVWGMTDEQVLAFNRTVIDTFRLHDGVIPEGPLAGNPMILLTTTGARTGRTHTTPLTYTVDPADGSPIVMASAGGSPRLPAWAHNLRAEPSVTVEILDETFGAIAVETEGDERTRVFDIMVSALPRFGEYQRSVERVIPLFRLVRL